MTDEPNMYDRHEAFAKRLTDAWLKHQDETHVICRPIEGDERRGFLDFFEGFGKVKHPDNRKYMLGRDLGHRMAYALGVMQSQRDGSAVEGDSQFAQFSAAWEAWADGYNDEDTLTQVLDAGKRIVAERREVCFTVRHSHPRLTGTYLMTRGKCNFALCDMSGAVLRTFVPNTDSVKDVMDKLNAVYPGASSWPFEPCEDVTGYVPLDGKED